MENDEVDHKGDEDYEGKDDPVMGLGQQNNSPRVNREDKVYSLRGRAETDCFQRLMVAEERSLPDNPNWWMVVKRRTGGSLNELPAL
jgi:hypothetical protein